MSYRPATAAKLAQAKTNSPPGSAGGRILYHPGPEYSARVTSTSSPAREFCLLGATAYAPIRAAVREPAAVPAEIAARKCCHRLAAKAYGRAAAARNRKRPGRARSRQKIFGD